MSGSFGGYYVSMSGIYTSQTALTITSSNISNADVEGYTRQQVIQTELCDGCGTDITEIRQIRSDYLDASYRQQNTSYGYWETCYNQMATLESSLYYGENCSLDAITSDFFNAWDEASTSPDDASVRSSVIEESVLLVDTLLKTADDIDSLRAQIGIEITDLTEQINGISKEIESLNASLKLATANGSETSLLMDEMNSLLDDLSYNADISTITKDNGTIEVYLSGEVLVNESGAKSIELVENKDGSYGLAWSRSGDAIDLKGGQLKCLMDLTASYTDDVPAFNCNSIGLLNAYEQTLAYYVTTLTTEVNSIHSSGTGLNGATGIDLFTAIDPDQPLSISNLQVNPLLDDVDYLACSDSGETGDGTKAAEIAQLFDEDLLTHSDQGYTFTEYCTGLTQWIGSQSSIASQNLTTQEAVMAQLDSERSSTNAVSSDEEMINMITYQQIYNANATVMDTLDSLLEYLIQNL